jgi:hypothetical protein
MSRLRKLVETHYNYTPDQVLGGKLDADVSVLSIVLLRPSRVNT